LLKLKARNQTELRELEEVPKKPLIKPSEKEMKLQGGQKKRSMNMLTVADHHQEEETKAVIENPLPTK